MNRLFPGKWLRVLLLVALTACMIPPWKEAGPQGSTNDLGFAPIFSPPYSSGQIDFSRLLVELFAIVIIGVIIYSLKSKPKDPAD